MSGSGATRFGDVIDYQAHVPGARLSVVSNSHKDFKAEIAWIELANLNLLQCHEILPRIADISFAPGRFFIEFPTRRGDSSICDGVKVQLGDIVFHKRDERIHQRTCGPYRWGLISLTPNYLETMGAAIAGVKLKTPDATRILRPTRPALTELRRLHAKAFSFAQSHPDLVRKNEVMHAIEQELLLVLVKCLASKNVRGLSDTQKRYAKIILKLEAVLAANTRRPQTAPKIAAIIGTSERTLRLACTEILGMGPKQYGRLKRLNMVRAALRDAHSPVHTVAEAANRYGFSEMGRFSATYRAVFGELPSTTLNRIKTDSGQ